MTESELLTDLVKQLDSIAAQLAQQEKNLNLGFDGEVQKLQHSFTIIKKLLNVAEERRFTDQAVRLWFDKLKDAYYMMDDVLYCWNASRTKSQIQIEENIIAAALKKKVRSFFPSPSLCFRHVKNLALRLDIGYKIKKLNETLDKIAKDTGTFGFDFNGQPKVVERPITTSFVDESDIIGRDNYRDELLSILLGKGSQEERNPHVISLLGMGGLGKTTLARIAYNHSEVQAHFDKKMWVCVSDPFDQCMVATAIIESLEGQSPNVTELQSLLGKLCSLIAGKRFFLVLDDVWTEDFTKWDPFRNALECGAEGSRILVTTRKTSVAYMMKSSLIINLGVLSPNDCWLIIKKIAFFDDYGEQYRDLEELGKQLANKCKGLPLAAKTLGSLLRFKRSREEWEGVLQSSLWEVDYIERGLLAPLLLSYCDLPLPLKQCFLYCAAFPKDYLFSRDELVLQWMAQGYIESKANMMMEIIAEEYFEILAKRSFFQDFMKDDGKIIYCRMHDIVHDFAQSMAKNESFQINSDYNLEIDCKSARHLHLEISSGMQFLGAVNHAKNLRTLFLLSHTRDYEFNMLLSDSFPNIRCLRTLILNYPIEKLTDAIGNLIHLRYLHLSAVVRISEFPETLCNLHNLQTLSIEDGCYLKKLPQGLGKLINLRHLRFSRDNYSKRVVSPKGIGKLTCLRTLSDFNIGGKDDRKGCKLGELKKLNHLRGTLGIHGLRNVEDVGEAQYAQLKKKIHLRGLVLKFGEFGEGMEVEEEDRTTRRMENDVLVLFALEPPPNLEILKIGEYMGSVFPNWMMSLTYLKELVLSECWKLECLPPLGKLPLLKSLKIGYLNNAQKVGEEFLGIDIEEEELSKNNNSIDISIFPNLKFLKFDGLEKWEEWTGMGGAIEEEEKDNSANAFVTNYTLKIKVMPVLHSLEIGRCGNLKSLPDYLRNTPLKELVLSECWKLECLPPLGKLRLLESLKIGYLNNVQKVGEEFLGIDIEEEELSKNNNNIDISIFPNLKFLKFDGLEKWEEWTGMGGTIEEEEKDNSANAFVTNYTLKIKIMPVLHSLEIGRCSNLKSLPDYLRNTPLKELVLSECWKLECLPPLGKLPILESLQIGYLNNVQKVGEEFLGIDIEEEELSKNNNNIDISIFPNLKFLKFDGLEKWEEWTGMGGTIEEEEKDNSANAFVTKNTPKIKIMPVLHSLEIGRCGNLKSLPDYLRNTPLKELVLSECWKLECLPPLWKLRLLESLKIGYLNNVQKVGEEFLGIDIEEEELSKNNNNIDIIIFPNLKFLKFDGLEKWEEWTGMGGTIEEEEKDNSTNAFVTNNTPKIKIMPVLHSLEIGRCGNLKSLPDYLRDTPLKELVLSECWKLECLPPLWKLRLLESLKIGYLNNVQKVGEEFLGIESEIKSKKDDCHIINIFPKLRVLEISNLQSWEEWIGMGGKREEVEDEKDSGLVSDPIIKIMPRLQRLTIEDCPKLKCLPDYLPTTPLQDLIICGCPILKQRCESERGDYWPIISHIPTINIR